MVLGSDHLPQNLRPQCAQFYFRNNAFKHANVPTDSVPREIFIDVGIVEGDFGACPCNAFMVNWKGKNFPFTYLEMFFINRKLINSLRLLH
jgi:hypothetical protein